MAYARVAVLLDYQNVHLTARDVFAPPGADATSTLVHPRRFAERVLAARRSPGSLAAVWVYRGIPSNARQPRLHAAAEAQRAEWTRDRRVVVHYRSLRYGKRPGDPPREKGVDVHFAVDLMRLAYTAKELDVVVLATHDTDLEPAIEAAAETGRIRVETAGWAGCRRLRTGQPTRHTALDAADFVAARDRRDYWGR